MEKAKRNLTLDLVKGVAIMAVIIGHLDNCADVLEYMPYKILHKLIYSFHMPLFFIVAGFFFRPKSIYQDFKRLFYPYFFLAIVCLLFIWITTQDMSHDHQMEHIKLFVKRVLWGSGGYSEAPYFGKVPDYLPVWFLCALLWCKQAFTVITSIVGKYHKENLYVLGIISLLLSMLFTYIDRRIIYIPLSFNQGLSAIIFFYIGYLARQIYNQGGFCVKKWHLVIVCLIVMINIPWGTIILAGCKYQCYWLNIVGASCTTIIIYFFCKMYLSRISIIVKFFRWAGVHSMLILCVHSFLIETKLLYPPPSFPIWVLVASISYCCILVWLLAKFKPIRQLFQLSIICWLINIFHLNYLSILFVCF